MVVCSSCGSTRIRNDYKPAPVYLRIIGVRALLCDYCNHQFRAFSPAPPRTRTSRNNGRGQIALEQKEGPPEKLNDTAPPDDEFDFIPISGGSIIPIQSSLRKEIARVQDARIARDTQEVNLPKEQQKDNQRGANATCCPECGSHWVRRRQRSGLERAVFALTNHKAFICRSCDASFYARVGCEESAANIEYPGSSRSAQT